MAIRSEVVLPVGTHAHLTVRTSAHLSIELDVFVRRVIDEPEFRGVGVEFVDMSDDAKRTLM